MAITLATPELRTYVGNPYQVVPTHVGELRATGAINQGYADFSGRIVEADRAALGSALGPRKDLKIELYDPGQPWHQVVIWEGLQDGTGPDDDAWASLEGFGLDAILHEADRDVLLRHDGIEVWGERDDEPYNQGENSPLWDVKIGKNVSFGIKRSNYVTAPTGSQIATIAHAGVCAQLEGAKIGRLKFNLWKTLLTGSMKLRVYQFSGPTGARLKIGSDLDLGAGGGAVNTAVAKTITPATPLQDSVRIDIVCVIAWNRKDADYEKVNVRRPQEYGVLADGVSIPADTMNARDVFIDLMNRVGFFTDSTICPTLASPFPVLPFWHHQGTPFAATATDMAIYAERVRATLTRVVGGASNRKPKSYLGARGVSPFRKWKVDVSDIVGLPRRTDREVANQVRVRYKNAAETKEPGRWRSVTINATFDGAADPLAGTDFSIAGGNPVLFTYELPDSQPDNAFADAICKALVREKRRPTWDGTMFIPSAKWVSGALPFAGAEANQECPGLLILMGDQVTVENFHGAGQHQLFDVDGIEITEDGMTVHVGRLPDESARWIAASEKAAQRGERLKEFV